ncbi:helix-turn-helix transcriptional regulator [Mesorhizobium abyssinicae]|uniref:helix-turn-helix domain-containing protein n=1 Tax=Mesorhizobium abyssinicae TaxID=1209958 RepID=UPI002A24B9F0|nr:helix-turn-helix transcriptional regulator [Mesorhizobium abyssinicae]MDX8436953.1 helix-turn-helix transcriptional regulator [Mesorhizobium abyssinicae]
MDVRDQLSAEQSRAARALLNWSRVRLAAKADLSEVAISDFENGVRKKPANIAAMRRALEGAGVVFTEGSPSLNGSAGPNIGRQADNRTWRHRRTRRAPTR